MALLHMVTLGRRVQFLPLKWKKGEKSTETWADRAQIPRVTM